MEAFERTASAEGDLLQNHASVYGLNETSDPNDDLIHGEGISNMATYLNGMIGGDDGGQAASAMPLQYNSPVFSQDPATSALQLPF